MTTETQPESMVNKTTTDSTLVYKRFEIYGAVTKTEPDPSAMLQVVSTNNPEVNGRLWRASYPFDQWVWESTPLDLTDSQPGKDWQRYFPDFVAHTAPKIWQVVIVRRNGKKAAELLANQEETLSPWLFPNEPAETRKDLWRGRIQLAEEALIIGKQRMVFVGDYLPKSFVWFLLQRVILDEMDQRMAEVGQTTSGNLNNLFKVSPKHLLQQDHLATLSQEIVAMRLRYESLVESVAFSRKFFPGRNDEKFYRLLVDELDLEAETEGLSDRLEALEEIYSLMGDRLTEFRYFFSEMVIEVLICIILLAEIYIMMMD